MNLRSVALWCILSGAGTSAWASPHEGDKTVVALYPFLILGEPDPALVKQSFAYLERTLTRVDDVVLVTGAELKKRMRAEPAKTLASCGNDTSCIASLGARARAQKSLLAMVTTRPKGGIKLAFIVVGTKTGAIEQKLAAELDSPNDIEPVLGNELFHLLGITTSGELIVMGGQAAVKIDGLPVGDGAGPFAVAPGWHEVEINGSVQNVTIFPGRTSSVDTGAKP